MKFEELRNDVLVWANERQLLKPDNQLRQALKSVSELGELCDAIIKNDIEGVKNEFGDVFVTLIILAEQMNINPSTCLHLAYDKIKIRDGETKNGIFIKK